MLNQIGVDLDREKKSSHLGCSTASIIRTAIGWQSEQVSDSISPMHIIGYVLAWPATATLAKVQRQAIKNGAAIRNTRRQPYFRDTQKSKNTGSVLSGTEQPSCTSISRRLKLREGLLATHGIVKDIMVTRLCYNRQLEVGR